jgi:iron(III) transport system substrate-binding protein
MVHIDYPRHELPPERIATLARSYVSLWHAAKAPRAASRVTLRGATFWATLARRQSSTSESLTKIAPCRGRSVMKAVALVLAALLASAGHSATLTPETGKLLADLKLSPDVLDGLDRELAVPQAWIDGARKEGALTVRFPAEEQRFATTIKVFQARYPGIEIEYIRGTGRARAAQPLIAFKSGKYLGDVIANWDAMEHQYREAGALIPLTGLPGYRNVPPNENAPGDIGVAYRMQHWCIGYNTKAVRKSDLPKTWDEILTNPRLRDGKIGVTGNIHSWLGTLWVAKGSDWVNGYIEKLFTVVKPQRRKENLIAYLKLMSLGEFDMGIPAGDFIVRQLEDDGLPVSLHCPDLVPSNPGWMGIMKGNPHPNAAKLFANWLLSKEGQIAAYRADASIPSHKDLLRREFLPYPDEILGHKIVVETPAAQANFAKIQAEFERYWMAGGNGGPR